MALLRVDEADRLVAAVYRDHRQDGPKDLLRHHGALLHQWFDRANPLSGDRYNGRFHADAGGRNRIARLSLSLSVDGPGGL